MSKHIGNRTGREAKRRRRRHARRTSDAMHRLHLIVDGEPVRDWGRLRASLRIGVDLAAGHDRTVIFPPRSGKAARMAELAELLRSGRVVISGPPPELEERRPPLTDSELALRYAWRSEFIAYGLPASRMLGINASGESDLRDYYGMDAAEPLRPEIVEKPFDPSFTATFDAVATSPVREGALVVMDSWGGVHEAPGQRPPIDVEEERARDWSAKFLPLPKDGE